MSTMSTIRDAGFDLKSDPFELLAVVVVRENQLDHAVAFWIVDIVDGGGALNLIVWSRLKRDDFNRIGRGPQCVKSYGALETPSFG